MLRAAGITHVLNVAADESPNLSYGIGFGGDEVPYRNGKGSTTRTKQVCRGVSEQKSRIPRREVPKGLKIASSPSSPGTRCAPSASAATVTPCVESASISATSALSLETVRRVALKDASNQRLLPYLDDLVDFVSRAVASGGRVLVHCSAGVSRSSSVMIAYLMRERGMSLTQAHDHVKARREVIKPNLSFWTSLERYEKDISARVQRQTLSAKRDVFKIKKKHR